LLWSLIGLISSIVLGIASFSSDDRLKRCSVAYLKVVSTPTHGKNGTHKKIQKIPLLRMVSGSGLVRHLQGSLRLAIAMRMNEDDPDMVMQSHNRVTI
jgi:hypothetical protein